MSDPILSNIDTILDFFLDVFVYIPPSNRKTRLSLDATKYTLYFDRSKLIEDTVQNRGSTSTSARTRSSPPLPPLAFPCPPFSVSASSSSSSSSSSISSSSSFLSRMASPLLPGSFPNPSDSETNTNTESEASTIDPIGEIRRGIMERWRRTVAPLHVFRDESVASGEETLELSSGTDSEFETSALFSSFSSTLPETEPILSDPRHTRRNSGEDILAKQLEANNKHEVFSVLLWNDDVHSFSDVYLQITRATQCAREVSQRLTVLVDEVGRAVVSETSDMQRAIEIAKILSHIELRVTIRPKKYVNREWMAASALSWLIQKVREEQPALTAIQRNYVRRLVCEALLQPWQSSLVHPAQFNAFLIYQAQLYTKNVYTIYTYLIQPIREKLKFHLKSYTNTRLFLMLMKDLEYWKQLRHTFKEFLVSMLLVDPKLKLELARTFAEAYPYLVYHTFVDSEPSHSVLFFAVQLFTSGVVALDLVEGGFFFLLLAMCRYETERALSKLQASKLRGLSILFRHLTYLLESPLVQNHLVQNLYYFNVFMEYLAQIHRWYKTKRRTGSHVELQVSEWEEALNTTVEMASPMNMIAAIYKSCPEALNKILELLKMHPVETHVICGFTLPKCNVLIEEISLHNHLHYMLARFQPTPKYLKSFPTDVIFKILDAPLTSLVYYAQESTGLWIRNGHHLLIHESFYFESKCHFLATCFYDCDFYLVQLAFRTLPPALIMPWVLDRFGFALFDENSLRWPYTMETADPYVFIEDRHKWGVLEALLLLLIQSITDVTFSMTNKEKEQDILMHFLPFEPKLFTDIVECLPDNGNGEFTALEPDLAILADFVQAPNAREPGKYVLKEEFYSHLNPFHKRYSRNQRAFLDQVLKQKGLSMLTPKAQIDPSFLIASEYLSKFYIQVLRESNLPPTLVDLYFALFAILLHTPPPMFQALGHDDRHPLVAFLENYPEVLQTWLNYAPQQGYAASVMNSLQQTASHSFPASPTFPTTADTAKNHVVSSSLAKPAEGSSTSESSLSKKELAMQRQRQIMEQMKQQQQNFAQKFASELASEGSEDDESIKEDALEGQLASRGSIFRVSSSISFDSQNRQPTEDNEVEVAREGPELFTESEIARMDVDGRTARVRSCKICPSEVESSCVASEIKGPPKEEIEEKCLVCHKRMVSTESYGYLVRFEVSQFLKRERVNQRRRPFETIRPVGCYLSTCGHMLHEHCIPMRLDGSNMMECPLCSRLSNAWIPWSNCSSTDTFLECIHALSNQKVKSFPTLFQTPSLFCLPLTKLSSTSPKVPRTSRDLRLRAVNDLSWDVSCFLPFTVLYTVHCVEIQLRTFQQPLPTVQLQFLRAVVPVVQTLLKEVDLPLWLPDADKSYPPSTYVDPFPPLFFYSLQKPDSWHAFLDSAYACFQDCFPLHENGNDARHLIFLRKCALLQAMLLLSLPVLDLLCMNVQALATALSLEPPLFKRTSSKKNALSSDVSGPVPFTIDDVAPYTLTPLPEAFEELLLLKAKFVCSKCHLTPNYIGMCLVCGEFVCLQGFCCMDPQTQMGEANLHKATCSGEQGLFFDFTRYSILILFAKDGQFLSEFVPYLDLHGESRHRGANLVRPMQLSKERYQQLTQLWMKHEIGNRFEAYSSTAILFNAIGLSRMEVWITF